jgi:hypothetical protein
MEINKEGGMGYKNLQAYKIGTTTLALGYNRKTILTLQRSFLLGVLICLREYL